MILVRQEIGDVLRDYRHGHLGIDPALNSLRAVGTFPLLDTDRTLAMLERACHPSGGGHADAGALVDLAIGHALLQQRHHLPAVRQRLQLGRRAQVAQERGDLFGAGQRGEGRSQAGQIGLGVFFSGGGA